jgi:CBS domain-containing protein
MATVQDLLKNKSPQVWYVTPNSSVNDALKLMADKEIGALLVIEAGKVVGVFSERDYVRHVALTANTDMNIPVRSLMSQPVFFVEPVLSIEECMALMTDRRIRHLPVMDKGQLIGLISIGDVVKQLIMEKEITIQDLEHYIWIHMI